MVLKVAFFLKFKFIQFSHNLEIFCYILISCDLIQGLDDWILLFASIGSFNCWAFPPFFPTAIDISLTH